MPKQIEEDSNDDWETHAYCKQCVKKKHIMRATMNLEEVESLDVNDNNLENF